MKNETFVFKQTQAVAAFQTTLCLVLMFTGVLGNGFICFLILRFKALRTIPNMLLTNLATVDLLNIIINGPFVILSNVYDLKTLYTKTTAWWSSFLFILFIMLNLTSMILLVLDRYLALAHSFKYMLWKTHRKGFFAICAVWICSLFIAGSVIMPLYNFDLGAKSVSYYRIAYTRRNDTKYYILPLILSLLIPIVVLSILTMDEVRKKSRFTTSKNGIQELRKNGRRTESATIRSAVTIMIVLLSYTICIVCGASFLVFAMSSEGSQQWLFFFGMYIMLCGSACNSLVYAVRSSHFRKAFKHIKCSQNRIHYQQKEVVFYISGPFGKKQVTHLNINISSTRIQGQYKAKGS